MSENYRVRYKSGEFEIEVESNEKNFVDSKLKELLQTTLTVESKPSTTPKKKQTNNVSRKSPAGENQNEENGLDILQIVNAINESDDNSKIDEQILQKSSQLNRVLLVLYFVLEEYDNSTFCSTSEVDKITDQLGVRMKAPNVAGQFKTNSKYFAASGVRTKGAQIKYKLNRKGISEYERIISL